MVGPGPTAHKDLQLVGIRRPLHTLLHLIRHTGIHLTCNDLLGGLGVETGMGAADLTVRTGAGVRSLGVGQAGRLTA